MNPGSSFASPVRLPLPIAKQLLAAISNAVISFLLVLFLAQQMGPAQFGDYAALLSLAVVLLIPIEGGWPARIYRDGVGACASTSAERLVGNGLAHLMTAALLFGVIGALIVNHPLPFAASMLCMLAVAAMNLVSGRLRALGRFGTDALWQTGGRVLSAACIVFCVIYIANSTSAVFLAWAFGLLIMLALIGSRWLQRPAWTGAGIAMRGTLAFLVVEVGAALLTKGDVAVVKAWGAEGASLSYYGACTRFNEMALLLWAPVGNVLLRQFRLQHAASHLPKESATKNHLFHWLGLAFAAGMVAWLAAWLAGDIVVTRLFGADYQPAGALLPYTASMLPFALSNVVLITALMARGRERWLAGWLIPAALLFLAAMGAGWHGFGSTGAALGVTACHALLAIHLWREIRRVEAAPAQAVG